MKSRALKKRNQPIYARCKVMGADVVMVVRFSSITDGVVVESTGGAPYQKGFKTQWVHHTDSHCWEILSNYQEKS